MQEIHATAIVHPQAHLGVDVKIGPYCIIGPNVTLGDGVYLHSHVVIDNVICEIGEKTELFPFVSINKTQDLKYQGEPSQVIIGKQCVIREYATIQPGTAGDKMKTVIGDNCLLMACTHVAHDCVLGNFVQMANHATLAGHVSIGDYAIIGGLAAVHQFVTIGPYAIVGGMSGVEADVIPYGNVKGDRAYLNGLNLIGLKRRGFTREQVDTLRSVYDALFQEGGPSTFSERLTDLQQKHQGDEVVSFLLDFAASQDRRALMRPKTLT